MRLVAPELGSWAAGRTSSAAVPGPVRRVSPLTISLPFAEFGNGAAVKQSASEFGFPLHCRTITWFRPSGVVGVNPVQLTCTT